MLSDILFVEGSPSPICRLKYAVSLGQAESYPNRYICTYPNRSYPNRYIWSVIQTAISAVFFHIGLFHLYNYVGLFVSDYMGVFYQ